MYGQSVGVQMLKCTNGVLNNMGKILYEVVTPQAPPLPSPTYQSAKQFFVIAIVNGTDVDFLTSYSQLISCSFSNTLHLFPFQQGSRFCLWYAVVTLNVAPQKLKASLLFIVQS